MVIMIHHRRIYFNLMIILGIPGFNCRQPPQAGMIVDGGNANKTRYPFIVSINGSYEGPSITVSI